jgi:putative transposase
LNAYTKAFNKLYDRRGSLFERPFKRKSINDPVYFKNLITYIHHNPVHHGFAEDINEWPYTSYHAYMLNKATKIEKKEGMSWFGGRDKFEAVHKRFKPEKAILLFEG